MTGDVSIGVPVVPGPTEGESLEDRLWREQENREWVAKMQRLVDEIERAVAEEEGPATT